MKALVYHGLRNVSLTGVPDATIEHSKDASFNITTTNIFGSDLHCRTNALMSGVKMLSGTRTSARWSREKVAQASWVKRMLGPPSA